MLNLLHQNDSNAIKKIFKDDVFLSHKLLTLLRYNNISFLEFSITADANKTYTGWEVRHVRVLNRYPSLNKQTAEYLVFDCDSAGTVNDVNFSLSNSLYQTFVREGKENNDWQKRQVMVKFTEKYRTAY